MPRSIVRVFGLLFGGLLLGCTPAAPPAAKPAAAPPSAPAAATPLAAGSMAAPTAAPAAAQPPTRVRVGLQNIAIDIPVYLAAERGYFQQEGVEAEVVDFANASEMIPALATEQLETAAISANAATWNAVARGVSFRIVLDKGSFRPGFGTTALLVRKEVYDAGRGRRLDDLRGLNLALTPPGKGTVNAVVIDHALKPVGQTIEDLTITPLPFPDMVAAMANGSIDAGMVAEPFQAQIVRQGTAVRVMGQDEMYPGFTVSVLAFTPTFYANQPAARAFVRAYLRGVRAYLTAFAGRPGEGERAQVEELIARRTRIDVATVRETVPPGFSPNGLPNIQSMLDSYQYFLAQGMIPVAVPESAMAGLWGTELVEAVLAEVGRLPEN